jgi:hypothetical protein
VIFELYNFCVAYIFLVFLLIFLVFIVYCAVLYRTVLCCTVLYAYTLLYPFHTELCPALRGVVLCSLSIDISVTAVVTVIVIAIVVKNSVTFF